MLLYLLLLLATPYLAHLYNWHKGTTGCQTCNDT